MEAVAHFTAALEQTVQAAAGTRARLREFDLRLGILGPLIAARGYGAREVERQIAHAVELSARIGAGDRIVPALFLNWIAPLQRDRRAASRWRARSRRWRRMAARSTN